MTLGNASKIADVVTDGPLMPVKRLRCMQTHKSRHQMHELLDVKQALLMWVWKPSTARCRQP